MHLTSWAILTTNKVLPSTLLHNKIDTPPRFATQDAIVELEKKLHLALDSALGILKSESVQEVARVKADVKQLQDAYNRIQRNS